jgi:pectate lyase
VGRLKVKYDDNWFDGTVQRNPRIRFGEPVHVFSSRAASCSDQNGLVNSDPPFSSGTGVGKIQ